MKKAFLNQMLLGFLAITAIVVFVATINDERLAKSKYYDLEDIANESIKALSSEYFKNMQGNLNNPVNTVMGAICLAEDKTNTLVQASTLGQELFNNNKIQYVWRDEGTYSASTNTYDGVADGRPDTITAVISSYTKENFWYKFLGKDTFTLPGFSRAVDLNRFTYNVNVNFRGVIEAGFYNMVGTYELDNNGCPQNPQLILDNKDDWQNKIGKTMASIEMPHTKMFFIADGYRRFGNYDSSTKQNSTISIDNTTLSFDNNGSSDCTTSGTFPTVVLTTDDGQVQRSDENDVTGKNLTSRANVYFEDTYLNFDNKSTHTEEIAEKDWGAFVAVMEKSSDWNSEAWDYYNSLPYWNRKDANGVNLKSSTNTYDGWTEYTNDHNINYTFDPNNEYVFVSEDLASTSNPNNSQFRHDEWASDRDFSDMSFSMLKIFVPEPIDHSLISSGSIINVVCP